MKKYPYICPDKTELKGQYDEAQVVHSKNGIFARRRGRWVMLVVRFNWKGLPPPPPRTPLYINLQSLTRNVF